MEDNVKKLPPQHAYPFPRLTVGDALRDKGGNGWLILNQMTQSQHARRLSF